MKKAIAGIVAIAGLASMAAAATTVTYQVRTVGGVWGSAIDAAPGTLVEFRALLSYSGTATAVGLAAFNSQPQLAGAVAGDTLAPFVNFGSGAAGGVANIDGGTYGRRYFAGLAGITSSNALRGHTNLVSGVRYLRIAQNNTTNFPGSGTGANNVAGSGGVAINQNQPLFAGAAFIGQTTNLEVYRFAVTVSGLADRTITVGTQAASMIVGTATPLVARVNWYTDMQASTTYTDSEVIVQTATIHVPTPGALALLGLGGLVAGRRRR